MGNPPTGTYFEKPKPQTKGWEEKIRTDYKNIYSKEYIDETVKYWGKIVSQAHQQGYREAVEKAKQLTINLIEESYKRGREDEAIECQKDMERVVEETRREVVEEIRDWVEQNRDERPDKLFNTDSKGGNYELGRRDENIVLINELVKILDKLALSSDGEKKGER